MAWNYYSDLSCYIKIHLTVVILYWIICCYAVLGTKCFRDENVGDRDGNVYYCEEGDKPECCEENQEFTCCESKSAKTWKEQLILWGSVGGLVLLITLLCCYFWRDNVCSKNETGLVQSCCTCCRKPERDDDKKQLAPESQPGPSRVITFSPRPWRFAGQGIHDEDRDSPAPAFHFKQPTFKKY